MRELESNLEPAQSACTQTIGPIFFILIIYAALLLYVFPQQLVTV